MATAFCWRTGMIEIGRKCPAGALPLAHGKPKALTAVIQGCGRLAYDGETYLVPGVPEADDEATAVAAVERFCEWLSRSLHAP